MAEFKTKLHQV